MRAKITHALLDVRDLRTSDNGCYQSPPFLRPRDQKKRRLWGLECGWGDNWVVFLGKTPNSYGDSLNPRVQMGTSEFNAGGNPAMD